VGCGDVVRPEIHGVAQVYKPVDPKVDFPAMEEGILEFWKENRIFEKSIENRAKADEFVFYDGPPFATGLPHFGHFVPGTIKDIIPRFRTMKGQRVERRFGWDCHGLPVEYEMEKELGISGKTEIEKFGVSEFNEACRSIVLRYTGEWRKTMTRSGRWVDFDHDYKTMDADYMESIWWVVKALWEKKLVYKGHYILPTCPRCSTPLSNHELNLGGYKDVHDPAITVRFRSTDESDTYFLAWTTTPWTLISNLGLSVGRNIDYVKVTDSSDGASYILAEARLKDYFKNEEEYKIVWTKKGVDLGGLTYEPLFPYFSKMAGQGAFKVFVGDHVSTEDGTGIVHTAPGFGEDDYEVMKDSGVPVVCPVDDEGRYTSEVADYEGRFVKDCDKDIMKRLKDEGSLVKRDQILHSYPHCWRCDSPLIYKAVGSWFVDIGKIKDVMLSSNDEVHWVPDHLKKGRFGKWLENARDWAISRNRYWGNPLPIWECDSCEATECLGSRDELYAKVGEEAAETHRADGGDLHKHHVDDLVWECDCGGTMKRIPEVLDCWFESGAMPYAQVHYPFENKEWFESHFPADFISEGLDQTRGWVLHPHDPRRCAL
jgi:isoleucyl-tRNA synthetase